MKKGKVSLALAFILLIVSLFLITLEVLIHFVSLPSILIELNNKISLYTSLFFSPWSGLEFGLLLLIEAILIFSFRLRRPFSSFLIFALPIIYFSLLVTLRVFLPLPSPYKIISRLREEEAKKVLLVLLVAIEVLLTLMLLPLTSALDKKWKLKYERRIKNLEKEGIIKSKEQEKEERLKIRVQKDNKKEEKKRLKSAKKFERERENARKKEEQKEERKERRNEKEYERVLEKEERKKEKKEEREKEKEGKKEDKEKEKREKEEEKLSKKEIKKLKKEKKREGDNDEDFVLSPPPEYIWTPLNPNTPLTFPSFIEITEAPKAESEIIEEKKQILIEEREELELEGPKTENKLENYSQPFKSGGIIEAALEEIRKSENENGRNREEVRIEQNEVEIKNYERKIEEGHIAPSNLSKDHPRYKLFQALQNPPRVPIQKEEKEEENIAPSNLSKDHPRYQLFQSLKDKNSGDESTVNEENINKRDKESFAEKEKIKEETEIFEPSVIKEEKVDVRRILTFGKENENSQEKVKEEQTLKDSEDEKKEENKQEYEIELVAGIGGLSSNTLGFNSILNRGKKLYNAPPLNLLKDYPNLNSGLDEDTQEVGKIIVETYAEQKINVTLTDITKGPTVTLYEFELEKGTKITKVIGVENELSYALSGVNVRILPNIPGKKAIGVEVPNKVKEIVGFKDLVYSLRANEKFSSYQIPMILGRAITGEARIIDVAKMPHMIIAGTTGSGKSVCINAFLNTILYQKSPQEVRLILVDPKVVELTSYNGIPHLLTPVITDAKRVIKALDFLVEEMKRRYTMMGSVGVRNITGYNEKIKEKHLALEKMPYIVLIMDEFADLMAVIKNEIDTQVSRLAALARAAGIHIILATQRPAQEVITGTLKSNLPARISFAVSSGMNSRIILDQMGAESLLGKGDMLLLDPSVGNLQRIQGAFLSDKEVDSVVGFVKDNSGETDYLDESLFEEVEEEKSDESSMVPVSEADSDEVLYERAKEIIYEQKQASTSYIQRRMRIGYNRAARIIDMLEERGIVGPANGSKPREILKYE